MHHRLPVAVLVVVRALRRRLADESGIALVLALGALFALSVSTVAVMTYTSSNQRGAVRDKSENLALALAEAGLNNSMAVLSLPGNNALSQNTLPACTGNAQTNWKHSPYEGGQVDWCGDLIMTQSLWKLTSIGIATDPTGKQVTRTVTAQVPVQPVVNQYDPNNLAFNYMFATNTGNTCDMIVNENVTIETALFVYGNLCLNNNSYVTKGPVIVRRRLQTGNTNSSVGTAAAPISVAVGGYDTGQGVKYCKEAGNSFHWHPDPSHATHSGCSTVDKVYGSGAGVNLSPPYIAKPELELQYWYEHAIPGPYQKCTAQNGAQSGPSSSFDIDLVRDNDFGATPFNLTPTSDYTCRVGPAWCPVPTCDPATAPYGELSWDYNPSLGYGTLTVRGVVFIDGSAYSNLNALNRYEGQGTLYLSGTFLLDNDAKLCGAVYGSGCDYRDPNTTGCAPPPTVGWDPNCKLLTIVADSNGGQAGTGNSILIDNGAQFQGALFATSGVTLQNNARTDGPIVAGTIILGQNFVSDDFGTIQTRPPGMPGSPVVYAQPNPPQSFGG